MTVMELLRLRDQIIDLAFKVKDREEYKTLMGIVDSIDFVLNKMEVNL